MKLRSFLSVATVFLIACGGGEEPANTGSGGAQGPAPAPGPQPGAVQPPPTGPLTVPEWLTVDNAARTVHIVMTAGATTANNSWNFNGAINGDLAITVPVGHTVSIEFTNHDAAMAHSLGISPVATSFMTPPTPTPVFPGAISQNPGSMIDGTMPHETETVTFVAEQPGNYMVVCYIPGHTAIGMWLYFNVSATGEAGVQTR